MQAVATEESGLRLLTLKDEQNKECQSAGSDGESPGELMSEKSEYSHFTA